MCSIAGCSYIKLQQNGFSGITPLNLIGSGQFGRDTSHVEIRSPGNFGPDLLKVAKMTAEKWKKLRLFITGIIHRFSNFPAAN